MIMIYSQFEYPILSNTELKSQKKYIWLYANFVCFSNKTSEES